MSATAKEFQAATVRAAVAALRREDGTRRFLIADEVGLGKTLVARDVVAALTARRRKPLVVFYVTSGSKVGDQNKRDLLAFLPEKERRACLSKADRLGLIPFTKSPQGKVHLYAFSPETSFPAADSRSSPGRAVERAFLSKLLASCLPKVHRSLGTTFFQLSATKRWPDALKAADTAMRQGVGRLPHAFRKALEAEFAPMDVREAVAASKCRPYALIARLRRALAEASLAANPPDLVILDEFQRYRRLLAPTQEDRIAARLLGSNASRTGRPAALLLSATPYRSYAERWEVGPQAQPHREFFDVVSFLGGEAAGVATASAFERFGEQLQVLGRLAPGDDHTKQLAEASATKAQLEALLRPYMSRTERVVRDDGEDRLAEGSGTSLEGVDLDVYRHFAERVDERFRSSAMAYWLSVPLPAQALGQSYRISRNVRFASRAAIPKLVSGRLYSPPVAGWGSAKLRRLHEIADPNSLALPWVSPSLSWWQPAGPWKGATAGKLLVFSRFRATPSALASLTSLEVERRLLGRSAESYRKAWNGRRLQPKRGRAATVALFHPSPFLIGETDVLDASARTRRQVQAVVRRQLVRALGSLGITVGGEVRGDDRRHRPGWEIIAAIDRAAGHRTAVERAWRPLGDRDKALEMLLAEHARARPLTWISRRELEDLLAMAVSGPAVALGRALRRHHPDVLDNGLPALTRLCWSGLRTYLDNPVFWARLGDGTPTETLQRAVLDGCFEAVMDEHFWTRSAKKAGEELADDLLQAFDAQVGWFTFRSLHDATEGVRVRCHAAVPFGGIEAEPADGKLTPGDRPHRSEGIRSAFNTPFWPHVLATTSVGQEGLDFHTWCDRIGHWDLCSSPVDLEQREGRIQRFGGLVVRRRLGTELTFRAGGGGPPGRSPWKSVAIEAERRFGDDSGLSPWWTLPGAHIGRHLFALPRSRDVQRFARLCRQRSLYRLALGQPRQEELVEMLGAKDPKVIAELARLALDLSAYGAELASGP
ncbi:C-terminal helicase domain-containing protein [Antarcticirhabdus aurantiaca]|uniref:DEAD/DEAH box helicase n=1 Tax=Antarcticirhabdus aurantiaca TaxID=2606717 RepID=A0ACD4NNT6_9HYPH|nr:DEAD/DEAH box helicase [Antarcticirhabdus aurantiaca]WAJ28418.1 DEAD/DEAH box helicase [Jeongeuplla avenae]